MGDHRPNKQRIMLPAAMLVTFGLGACDENGEFAFPMAAQTAEAEQSAAPVRTVTTTEEDVERPDLFGVTTRGLWDGRPSLGGVWVAHPDVTDPERARIRNTLTGESIVGALFRRERENPGPALQVSSDAAEALGMLAGAPTELSVVVLRREEVTVETVAPAPETTEVEELPAPAEVDATDLAPAGAVAVGSAAAVAAPAAEAVTEVAEEAAEIVEVNLPPAPAAVPEPEAVAEATAAVAADIPAPPASFEVGTGSIQIGVFSLEANAEKTAQRIRDAGIATMVLPEDAGGRTVWRVVSEGSTDATARDLTIAQIKDLGFVDAFAISL